ncbi:MAG: hypothetical protein P1U63_05380 [Coxiellaceae bacterium]|nr:hypothetical protein [Coxiellaceae bacterium]
MSTVHVFDIHDFLKAELRTDTTYVAAGVRVSGNRIQRFLSGVKAGDQVIFITPMRDTRFMLRLSASNMGDRRIYLPGINPATILDQLHYMRRHNKERFFPTADFVAVLDFNELDDEKNYRIAALANYRVDAASGGLTEVAPVYREVGAEDHVRYYSSDAGFAASLEGYFKDAASHTQAHLAAAGQLWPAHKEALLKDLAGERVVSVVSDMDETFLLTGLTAVVETNLCHGCDQIYQRLFSLFADITDYPVEGSSQQRFAFLKSQLVANFKNGYGRLSEATFDGLNAALASLHSQELYGARLDGWFNALRSNHEILPAKCISQMDGAYRALSAMEDNGAYGEREKELRNMLVTWSENLSHPEALKALAKDYLITLDRLGAQLYYKHIVSEDNLECLRKAKMRGAETLFITSRPRPLPADVAAIDAFAISSTISSLSREDVRKPDKQLQQMSESTSYLDSRHHHCHQKGPAGEILGPVHYSTKMMYHTIRLIVSGKKFDQAETQYCWLLDDNPYETHPELVRQCNALFALHDMNLRWKVALPCKGGEYLMEASPRPELAAFEADKSATLCEHCIPSKLLSLITQRYALLGGGGDIAEALFQQAYDEAWHQVSLARSLPVASVPSVTPSVTSETIRSMGDALAEIAARRAKAKPKPKVEVAESKAVIPEPPAEVFELPLDCDIGVVHTVRVKDDLSNLFTPMPEERGPKI